MTIEYIIICILGLLCLVFLASSYYFALNAGANPDKITRIDRFETYLNLNNYTKFGVGVNDDMSWKDLRHIYYSFKPYPYHDDMVSEIINNVCDGNGG